MRVLFRISYLLFLVLLAFTVYGQTTYEGEVIGRGNFKVLRGVTILIKSELGSRSYFSTNGKYEIEVRSKEAYIFNLEGYRKLTIGSLPKNGKVFLDPVNWDNNRIQIGAAHGIENPIGLNLEFVSPIIGRNKRSNFSIGTDIAYQGDWNSDYWVSSSVTLFHLLKDRFTNLDIQWRNNWMRQTGDFNYYTHAISLVFGKHAGLKGSIGLSKYRRDTDDTFFKKIGGAIGLTYGIKGVAILEVNTNVIRGSNEYDVRLSRWFGNINFYANYHELDSFQEFAIGLKKRFLY